MGYNWSNKYYSISIQSVILTKKIKVDTEEETAYSINETGQIRYRKKTLTITIRGAQIH